MVVVEAGERERVVADFNPQARRLVTADDTTSVWGPYDREPLPRWTRGRLALRGDAAHPMLPHIAQGTNQALEDAMALATLAAWGHCCRCHLSPDASSDAAARAHCASPPVRPHQRNPGGLGASGEPRPSPGAELRREASGARCSTTSNVMTRGQDR